MKKNVYRTILLYSSMALMIASLALFGNTDQEKEELHSPRHDMCWCTR